MRFRKYEHSAYDDDTLVVRNPENGEVVLLNEEEASALHYMENAGAEHILDILLPAAGIAKKNHIRATLSGVAKLKRAGLLELSAPDRKFNSDTITGGMDIPREPIRFTGLDSMAATLAGLFGRILAIFGSAGLTALLLAFAAIAAVFFPFEHANAFLEAGPSYSQILLGSYFFVCLALSVRSVAQVAYLKTQRRRIDEIRFSFLGPFLYIRGIGSAHWLLGRRGRLLDSLLSLLSPIALAGVFVVLERAHVVSLLTLWTIFPAAVATSLLLLCPLVRADGAEILNLILYPYQPRNSVVEEARGALLQRQPNLSRGAGAALLASLLWYLVALDLLRSYWDVLAFRVVPDLMHPVNVSVFLGAAVTAIVFVILAFLPPLACVVLVFRGAFSKRKKTGIAPLPEGSTAELDFDEQMSALEKVPLFAALASNDRLQLFNEMQAVIFKLGESLVKQGEIGREFFVLIRGKARAIYQDPHGKKHIVNELGEGDAFGEIALLDDVPRTASIVSAGTSNVLVLRKAAFERVVQNLGSPEKVKQMIRLTSFFRRHPLFSKLNPREQADLIHAFNFEVLAPGDEVREDVSGDHFYVVYSGKLRVDTGDDSTDTTIESDDCFGYTQGIQKKIVAADGAGLLRIRRDQFDALIWQKLVERPELFI